MQIGLNMDDPKSNKIRCRCWTPGSNRNMKRTRHSRIQMRMERHCDTRKKQQGIHEEISQRLKQNRRTLGNRRMTGCQVERRLKREVQVRTWQTPGVKPVTTKMFLSSPTIPHCYTTSTGFRFKTKPKTDHDPHYLHLCNLVTLFFISFFKYNWELRAMRRGPAVAELGVERTTFQSVGPHHHHRATTCLWYTSAA